MTNYKRFVSYFYQYESGRKNSSTGYARIETSDEVCKVTLNCSFKTIAGRVGRVYFVKKYHDQTDGILVGTATTKEDGLEARVSMPKGAIENARIRFYEITGIVVCFSKENYFVTEWDGAPITYRQVASFEEKYAGGVVLEKEDKEKEQEVVEVVDTKSEKIIEVVPVPKGGKEKEEKAKEERVKSKEDEMVSKESSNEVSQEIVSIEKEEKMQKEETQDKVINNAKEQQEENQVTQESTEIQFMQTSSEEELKAASVEEELKVSSIEAADASEQSQDSVNEEEEALDDNDAVVSVANCMTTPSVPEKESWCDHPSARAILDRFPHMYPFDDGEITECVRIEPKDLGLLPIDAWILGNNSFLLHAFCTYRHLLFAKKMTREGIYYMVMVPGAYNAREKHMASMFGFREFKCSRRRKMRDGEFGYWYLYVDYSSTCTC